jgi:hypothetical protein
VPAHPPGTEAGFGEARPGGPPKLEILPGHPVSGVSQAGRLIGRSQPRSGALDSLGCFFQPSDLRNRQITAQEARHGVQMARQAMRTADLVVRGQNRPW